MTAAAGFSFPTETLAFLADVRRHNTKPWFDANRTHFDAAYLEPAKTFVERVAPHLRKVVPGIVAEPRVNGSIFRINRDVRFSTDKTPYKDHLDFWFWEGERKTALSGLFLRVAPEAITVGAGSHGFDRTHLDNYRAAVAEPRSGGELAAIVSRLGRQGHTVGGETYSRAPRGYRVEDDRERLLRHSALYVHAEHPAELATDPALVPTLLRRWRAFASLHRWLVANVRSPRARRELPIAAVHRAPARS